MVTKTMGNFCSFRTSRSLGFRFIWSRSFRYSNCAASGLYKERVDSVVIRVFRQFRLCPSQIELMVEILAPGVHFLPRHLTASDRKQAVSVFSNLHGNSALKQHRYPRNQEPN